MRQTTLATDDGQLFTPEIKADIQNTKREMLDMLLMLSAPTLISLYYYGVRAFYLQVTAVLTCVLTEYIFGKLFKNTPTLRDLSAVVTGLILALCLPASVPIWLAALGAFFAIFVAKLPFGNARSLLFSPAAAGLCFLAVCFPNMMFTYPLVPAPFESVGVYGTSDFIAGTSLAGMLSSSTSMGHNIINYLIVLLGDYAGPMGTTCILALCGSLLFLAIRHFKSFEVTASYLLTVALLAFLFPRILTGRWQSVFMELSSGMLFFASIFLLPNTYLLPKRFYGRILYGVVAAIGTMILRHFGAFEEGVIFVVLVMNATATGFDKLPLAGFERKRLSAARKVRLDEARKKADEEAHAQWFKEAETETADLPQAEAGEAEAQAVSETISETISQADSKAAPAVKEEQEGGGADV